MQPRASAIDAYLDSVPTACPEDTRQIVALMREELPGADERVQWGIAIFSESGQDITGIAARKSFLSLYVPQGDVANDFATRLGKVDAGKGCLRFKKLADIDLDQLRQMVRALRSR